tara:strand:- start:1186 stop:1383 length:198 start_codon:yes stop_codon:yes gene_type:complete
MFDMPMPPHFLADDTIVCHPLRLEYVEFILEGSSASIICASNAPMDGYLIVNNAEEEWRDYCAVR